MDLCAPDGVNPMREGALSLGRCYFSIMEDGDCHKGDNWFAKWKSKVHNCVHVLQHLLSTPRLLDCVVLWNFCRSCSITQILNLQAAQADSHNVWRTKICVFCDTVSGISVCHCGQGPQNSRLPTLPLWWSCQLTVVRHKGRECGGHQHNTNSVYSSVFFREIEPTGCVYTYTHTYLSINQLVNWWRDKKRFIIGNWFTWLWRLVSPKYVD